MDSLFLCWKVADPDSLCCWLAQMDAGGRVACHRQRHSLIVFALMDAHARARTQIQARHEIQKLGVFFIDAQDFVTSPHFGIRQTPPSAFASPLGHAAKQWHAMRAAAITAKAF